jgi:hypothetical protein
MTIPPGALLAVEFATSSSVAAPPYGNGVPSSGDADTPTSDLNGQAQWLSNSLCAFDSVGMTKLAYFGLYDASDFWAAAPFNIDPASDLMGWNGYWGLLPLQGAAKPAWTTLTNYYRSGVQSLGCSLPAPPVLTLTADKQSVAAGQPLKLTWTAADTTSMSLSGVGPVVGSYDSKTIFPSGSGPVTYTLTANNGSVQRSVSVSVNVTGGQSFSTLTVSINGAGNIISSPAGINCPSACSGSFPTGSTVTLSAIPASNYVFSGWSGGGCSGTGSCTLALNQATNVSATFTQSLQTLAVSFAGSGAGVVTSSPAGISCSSNCSAAFSSGTQVSLTATPSSGSVFAGWSGGGCSGTGSCTIVMSSSQSVAATFNVAAPVINSVTDSNYSTNLLTTTGTIIVWGANFTVSGNNTLQFHSYNGYADVWMSQGDGHYYWDYASGQINAGLDGRLAAGWWMLTVRNAAGVPSAGFNVYINAPAPTISSVTDSNYSTNLQTTTGTIIVWGSNFSPSGNNTLQFHSSNGYADVWMYQGDGHYYWDYASGQINASLDGRLAAGWWMLTVRNASGVASAGFNVYINTPVPAPAITAITDSAYSSTLYQWSTIIVWGANFSPGGFNTIQFQSSNGYPDVWAYQGDGHYYWDYATGQINASLDYRLQSGWWLVTVRNANGVQSPAYWIYIN